MTRYPREDIFRRRTRSKKRVAVQGDPLPRKTLSVLGQPLRLAVESFLLAKRGPLTGEMLCLDEECAFFPDGPGPQRFALGETISQQRLGGELLVGGKIFDPMEHYLNLDFGTV